MDVKALARSKRSHTKHHQPRKPHRPAALSTPSSSSSSKDPNKEGKKKSSNHGSYLPSNLDRYYDSDEEEEEGLFGSDSGPKSKGADFGFLISQALSQSPPNFTESFDSFCTDFSHGRGSMLSVLGENILSWTGGDDFLMEDERPTNHEVSFLSLDLQTLSKDFARITHSRRLFIEEDILPGEMRASQKNEANDDLGVVDPKKSFKACEEEGEVENKMSRFEAKAAEAELDTLLESFNEAKLFDSSSNMGSSSKVSSAAAASLFPASNGNMENEIDDLLSNFALRKANAADSMAKQLSSRPSSGSKSLVIEDFDSFLDT